MKATLLFPDATRRRNAGGRVLPVASENLFTRIIRNPLSGSSLPRERQCTEMLAALLLNAPFARKRFCEYLAKRSGSNGGIKHCDFEISTEQPIGRKRDDLRIEAWDVGEKKTRKFLWTIEVKVGAWFHESSINNDDTPDGFEESINQLVIYDKWLYVEQAEARAGFVLAIEDLTTSLPTDLRCSWHCFTWTSLGIAIKEWLDDTAMPTEDRLLCRHVLGFIAAFLWRNAEMPDVKVDFEDVAFLRAWVLMAEDCEQKLKHLMKPVEALVLKAPFAHGKAIKGMDLYGKWGNIAYGRELLKDADDGLQLWAGITAFRSGEAEDRGDGAYLNVWIYAPKRHALNRAIVGLHETLRQKSAMWERDIDIYWLLWKAKPLVDLLQSEGDQSGAIRDFVATAIDELTSAGIGKIIQGSITG